MYHINKTLQKIKHTTINVKLLLISSFLIPVSTFMLIPFLPIILHDKAEANYKIIGISLGIMTFIHFSGGFVGRFVINYLGEKKSMLLAIFIRMIGFFFLFLVDYNINKISIALYLIACGGAIYLPANKSYIIKSIKQKDRAFFLSISNISLNGGRLLGPLFGGFLVLHNTKLVILTISLIFLFLFIIHFVYLKNIENKKQALKMLEEQDKINKKVIWTIFIFNFFAFYIRAFFANYIGPYMNLSFDSLFFSILISFNAIIVIGFQTMLVNFIDKTNFYKIILIAFIFNAITFYLFSFNNLTIIFLAIIFLSFSEIMWLLKMDLQMIKEFNDDAVASFSYLRLSAGIGTLIGSIIGGYMYNYYSQIQKITNFWQTNSLQIIFIILLILIAYKLVALKNK